MPEGWGSGCGASLLSAPLPGAGEVVGAAVGDVVGSGEGGCSAAKATPAEAAIRPRAAVAESRDEVVFFIVSPGMNVVRDECVTLTSTGRVASRRSRLPYNTS